MYYEVSDEKIGKYLGKLIASRFNKDRQFAIAYLKLRDKTEDPAPDDIQKMANKICQIKKGKKGIQIADLPIFSYLLGVSADNIISAGAVVTNNEPRVTNYSIALSKKKSDWDSYVKRPDKLILNPDEYGKTVLDYAIEFGNYKLLKYLMNQGYIWFVDADTSKYAFSFGAGTSIERRLPKDTDLLNVKMAESDFLRTNMIALALKNSDFEMLDKLKAREIPTLYYAHSWGPTKLDYKRFYNPDMLKAILESNDKTLTYFSEEFLIDGSLLSKQQYTFVFPYLGKLLESAIKKKAKAVPQMLKNALHHNKNVLNMVEKTAKLSAAGYHAYSAYYDSKNVEELVMRYFHFDAEEGTVCIYPRGVEAPSQAIGVFSNLVKVTASSEDEYVQSLIDDLNISYNKVAEYQFSEAQKEHTND